MDTEKIDTENSSLDTQDTPEINNEPENNAPSEKTTHWIGGICIVLFFNFSGWSVCPWYMWIVFGLLALITLGGIYKWGQAFLGIILLIWGTTLFGNGKSEYNDSHYETSSSSYQNSSNDEQQSESERREIERAIQELETMQSEFQKAWDRGDRTKAKLISDAAERKYQALQQRNLTRAQRNRLSNLFAL